MLRKYLNPSHYVKSDNNTLLPVERRIKLLLHAYVASKPIIILEVNHLATYKMDKTNQILRRLWFLYNFCSEDNNLLESGFFFDKCARQLFA